MNRLRSQTRFQSDLERMERAKVPDDKESHGINIGVVLLMFVAAALAVLVLVPLLKHA